MSSEDANVMRKAIAELPALIRAMQADNEACRKLLLECQETLEHCRYSELPLARKVAKFLSGTPQAEAAPDDEFDPHDCSAIPGRIEHAEAMFGKAAAPSPEGLSDQLLNALTAILGMDVKGHQLRDRLQFSDSGRSLLKQADDAIEAAAAGRKE